jgi:hypothetical protein
MLTRKSAETREGVFRVIGLPCRLVSFYEDIILPLNRKFSGFANGAKPKDS